MISNIKNTHRQFGFIMKIVQFSIMAVMALAAFTGSAKADYAVWSDAKTGLSLTFPDTWKQVNNKLPIDVITLSVPSGDHNAMCSVRAEEDKRFLIYPNRYRKDIQEQNFTMKYLERYFSSLNNVNLLRYTDNAGLGQGFASMVLVSFMNPSMTNDASDVQDKGGIMAVTNYGDKVYVAECSSSLPSYGDYHQQFISFFKSISFKKFYHESVVGDYRNFLNEMGTINVPFPNAVSRSTY